MFQEEENKKHVYVAIKECIGVEECSSVAKY
jgi:hypothetical protein